MRGAETPSGPRPTPILNSPPVSLSVKTTLGPQGVGPTDGSVPPPLAIITIFAGKPKWLTLVGNTDGRSMWHVGWTSEGRELVNSGRQRRWSVLPVIPVAEDLAHHRRADAIDVLQPDEAEGAVQRFRQRIAGGL